MSITSCIFSSSNALNVGAIYFKSNYQNSQAKLSKVCGYKCSTRPNGYVNFAVLGVFSSSNCKTEILLSSILNCHNTEEGKYTFIVEKGDILISELNLSKNYCEKGSLGQYFSPFKLRASLCTFFKNPISLWCAMELSGGGDSTFSQSNFIENNSPDNSQGVITATSGIFNIHDCVFIDNSDILFYRTNAFVFSISYSYISHHDVDKIYFGEITKTENTLEIAPTHKIVHLKTYLCLNNIEPDRTPHLTLQETPDLTCIETPINTLELTPVFTLQDTLQFTPENTLFQTISLTMDQTCKETFNPTLMETFNPTLEKTLIPTKKNTLNPTFRETLFQTNEDTKNPTIDLTFYPTVGITFYPTFRETLFQTNEKTINPTISLTFNPTIGITFNPTIGITFNPTFRESLFQTNEKTINIESYSNLNVGTTLVLVFGVIIGLGIFFLGILHFINIYYKQDQSINSDEKDDEVSI